MPSQQKSIDDIYKGKKKKTLDEDTMDAATVEQKLENLDGRYSAEDMEDIKNSLLKLMKAGYKTLMRLVMDSGPLMRLFVLNVFRGKK